MANQLPAGAGASNSLFQHDRPNNPNRSRFDLSRITNFTADDGMIIPFDWFMTLPDDDFDINFNMVLDTMPLINSSLTQYKVTTHWYYMKLSDLWKGAKVLLTKGRTGNISKMVPRVDLLRPYRDSTFDVEFDAPAETYVELEYLHLGSHSLASFLGVPSVYNGDWDLVVGDNNYTVNMTSHYLPYVRYPSAAIINTVYNAQALQDIRESISTGFNQYRYPCAFQFMMYQSVVKHNYVNQNLLLENKALFPDEGDDDWMLPYDATVTNFVGIANNDDVNDIVEVYNYDGVFSSDDKCVSLLCLRYAQFDDDYFTTGLPWLQRGDANTLQFDVDLSSIMMRLESNDIPVSVYTGSAGGGAFSTARVIPNPALSGSSLIGTTSTNNTSSLFVKSSDVLNNMHIASSASGTVNASITANNLRELIAMSVWQERNARVDGSYNRMIYQHWHVNPHSDEHLPIYIGGTSDNIAFSNIVQTSQTTDDSPLGTTSGYGRAGGRSYVGRFHSPDYGIIMGIMIIRPNTTYQQGVEHALSCENVFEDFVQPEFEGLSPQPILNKELFVSEDNGVNDDMFAYQERGTYLKVRQNVNRGLFQCKPNKDSLFGTYTQARWFDKLPKLSYQFLVMSPDNLRRDFLAYPAYPKFKVQAASEVFVTRSLSYTSEPNTFGF